MIKIRLPKVQLVPPPRKSGLKCEGINLFLVDGKAAMQEVFHGHLHVFPRYEGDGFGLKFSPEYFKWPTRAELDEAAGKIRKALMEYIPPDNEENPTEM